MKATEGKGHHEKLSIHSKIGIFKASDLLIERHTCKPRSSNIISPVGRLRSQYNNWANITSNSYILDIVDHGYKIPFINTPPSVILENNLSARSDLDFVSEEIKTLLQKGCISECDKIPQIVNPLTVAYNRNGKPRLVLDCRSINPLLYKYKFRMEDTICARQMFKAGDYMCTFDLRSAYHHISINHEHKTYLGFSHFDGTRKVYYTYEVLPFGISTAGFIFTKLLRVLVQHWRSMGIKIILYLDDGILAADTPEACKRASEKVRSDLNDLGFLLADEKCVWEPKQIAIGLGHVLDTTSSQILITEDRIIKTENNLTEIMSRINTGNLWIRAKALASAIGQIQSMKNALDFNVDLMTKFSHMCVESKASWSSKVFMSSNVVDEINFWLQNIRIKNGQSFDNQDAHIISYTCYSDASVSGYGGYTVTLRGSETTGLWTSEEANQSSSWREAEAVLRVLQENKQILAGNTFEWFCDNKNVTSIINKGSMVASLQNIAMNISKLCDDFAITLVPKWIPREDNWYADMLSKYNTDTDDWCVHSFLFKYLDSKWGPYDIDLFASYYNAKCQMFYSKDFCYHASGVNAFNFSWEVKNHWIVPPPNLLVKTINKILHDNATCTLIVPKWESAPFWPILIDIESNKTCIKSKFTFSCRLIKKGKYIGTIFGKSGSNFEMLAIKFAFA